MSSLIAKFHGLSPAQQILLVIVLGAAFLFFGFKFMDTLGKEGAGRTFGWVVIVIVVGLFIYFAVIATTSVARVVPSL